MRHREVAVLLLNGEANTRLQHHSLMQGQWQSSCENVSNAHTRSTQCDCLIIALQRTKLCLEKLCCNPASFWLVLEEHHSLAVSSWASSEISRERAPNIPEADMHMTTVTKEPHFVDETLWTTFFPIRVTIFQALCWTIVMQVPSTFYTFIGSNFIFSNSAFSVEKNSWALCFVYP